MFQNDTTRPRNITILSVLTVAFLAFFIPVYFMQGKITDVVKTDSLFLVAMILAIPQFFVARSYVFWFFKSLKQKTFGYMTLLLVCLCTMPFSGFITLFVLIGIAVIIVDLLKKLI